MSPSCPSPPFLLDVMLGKLTTYLRMCGYDAAYGLDRGIEDDDAVLALARRERRTLVTRDRELADRTDDGLLIESRDVPDQLRELRAAGVDLTLDEPQRCSTCNRRLSQLPAGATTPNHVPDAADGVWQCVGCEQHFWRGSHWEDVADTLSSL